MKKEESGSQMGETPKFRVSCSPRPETNSSSLTTFRKQGRDVLKRGFEKKGLKKLNQLRGKRVAEWEFFSNDQKKTS